MTQKSSTIMLLLSILGLLSMSNGLLHKGKKVDQSQAIPFTLVDAEEMSAPEIRRTIDPLIFSHSVYSIAPVLEAVSSAITKEILHDLFAKPNPLTRDDKILLLLLVAQAQKNKKEQDQLLDMLLSYPELRKGRPILALAAQVDDPKVLKTILGWMAYHKKKKDYADLEGWVKAGLQSMLQDNDFVGFKRLLEQRIRVGSEFAARMLLRAIQENKDVRFVPLLISKGVNPNYVGPNKRTLLMEAVLKKNSKMVKTLLKLGADPNFIIDPAHGSAIQLAYERGYVDLELLMRRWAENKKS